MGMGYETRQGGSVNQTITGLVARRGGALMIYTTSEGFYDPGRLTKNARKMAVKCARSRVSASRSGPERRWRD
ncbi:hypothetical protein GCM10020220_067430 [Nonomuraea rubra]